MRIDAASDSLFCIAWRATGPPTAQFLTGGQTPAERPFTIVKLDPALDAIIDPGAKAELLGDRFGLTEGAVWIQEGRRLSPVRRHARQRHLQVGAGQGRSRCTSRTPATPEATS